MIFLQVINLLVVKSAEDLMDSVEYQRRCMHRTVDNPDRFSNDVCVWHGVLCAEHNIIFRIEWRSVRIASFGWLPSHVSHVYITGNTLPQELQTRLLPRSLVSCDLRSDSLRGSIDLTMLPSGLKEITLSGNGFSGRIFLADLPRTLRKIVFDWNRNIKQILVDSENLPDELIQVQILRRMQDKDLASIDFFPTAMRDRRVQFYLNAF